MTIVCTARPPVYRTFRVILKRTIDIRNKIHRMDSHTKYLKFYLGCETNKGQLIGIDSESLFIKQPKLPSIENYKLDSVGIEVFVYLRRLNSLTDQERGELIKNGFNIGRPSGYSFSSNAFMFLIDLNVDLFGLIEAGLAKDILMVYPQKT